MEIPGIHHVTAISGDASGNVRFYTRTLGMRLVKKTVNQDDLSAYHLFYGDETGSPGTEVTFFDWPRNPSAVPGAGTIAPVALRVPGADALAWWEERLDDLEVGHGPIEERDGRTVLSLTDSEGQRLELVDDRGVPGGHPWDRAAVPPERAITGVHDVTITSAHPEQTAAVLTRLLGFRKAGAFELPGGSGTVTVFETGRGGAGAQVRVVAPRSPSPGQAGVGGVHHVAFRTPNDEEHREWRERVAAAGLSVTPVIDRYYFRSLYFREPGGALFEIATDGPGFTADEPADTLGEHLALPPFLEARRAEIEAGLRPIEVRPA
ncbi:MAG TPA: ring-cleaving dioxygenase [Candidatus Dormibacteraeota bacterium]